MPKCRDFIYNLYTQYFQTNKIYFPAFFVISRITISLHPTDIRLWYIPFYMEHSTLTLIKAKEWDEISIH